MALIAASIGSATGGPEEDALKKNQDQFQGTWVGALAMLGTHATASAVEVATVEHLVRELGNEAFDEREAASQALRQIGEPALSALRRAALNEDPEIRRRASELVTEIEAVRAERMRVRVLAALDGLEGRFEVDRDRPGCPLIGIYFKNNMRITDKHLAYLKGLDTLQTLVLYQCCVTDAGLAHLDGLRNLRKLDLGLTDVTDEGMKHLQSLDRLTDLSLSITKVSDEGLAHLKRLPCLSSLCLYGNRVTDGGLKHLEHLKNLKTLSLDEAGPVTEEGIARLEEALPGISISNAE
jgi:hypothetical protein